MATVHVSKHPANNHEVLEHIDHNVHLTRYNKSAILVAKILDLDKCTDEEIQTLIRTVCWTRGLRHKNLMPITSTFLDHHKLWIVSPHYDLGSAATLSQPVGLEERQIAFIIREVLKGVEYLHERGFIHRAINASHILVNSDGRICLTGMKYNTNVIKDGRWRLVLHDYPNNAHKNLNWFSPEILEQNLLGYDYKTDIYSLGVTCCELANGIVPYSNLEPTKILLDKLTGNRPEPIDSTNCHFNGSKHRKLLLANTKYYIFSSIVLTSDQVQMVEAYSKRTFSHSFHSFARDLCMADDRHRRPNATQLLNHKFIKQAKKVAHFNLSSNTSAGREKGSSPKTVGHSSPNHPGHQHQTNNSPRGSPRTPVHEKVNWNL